MAKSLIRKSYGRGLHHPERVTAGSLMNGRHLEPAAMARAKHWQRGMFRELSRRPILEMTANKSPKELELYLGAGTEEASMDRLVEMTGGRFIQLDGESYRRKEGI